jgi:hypothetical protein
MAICQDCEQENANRRMTTIFKIEESEIGNV